MLEGLTKAFERDNYVCCLVTSLKIYQIRVDYSGWECTRTPPAPLPKCTKLGSLQKNTKNVFTLEEKSAIGEGKHSERRLIKCSRWLANVGVKALRHSRCRPASLPHLLLTMANASEKKEWKKFNSNQSEWVRKSPPSTPVRCVILGLEWLWPGYWKRDRWGVWNLASSRGGKSMPEISWRISCQNFNLWTWDTTNVDPAVSSFTSTAQWVRRLADGRGRQIWMQQMGF